MILFTLPPSCSSNMVREGRNASGSERVLLPATGPLIKFYTAVIKSILCTYITVWSWPQAGLVQSSPDNRKKSPLPKPETPLPTRTRTVWSVVLRWVVQNHSN